MIHTQLQDDTSSFTDEQNAGVSVQKIFNDVVASNNGQPIPRAPFAHNGEAQTYYNKALNITTQPAGKIRRVLETLNALAADNLLPAPNAEAIEWGNADQMKNAFFSIPQDANKIFVHARDIVLDIANSPELQSQEPMEKIFVTGSCLFAKDGALGLTDKGQQLGICDPFQMRAATPETTGTIQSFDILPYMHGYEISSPLNRYNLMNMMNPDKVYFNVPVGSYLLYAKDAIKDGLMDKEVFKSWANDVATRAEAVIALEKAATGAEIIAIDPLYKFIPSLMDENITVAELAQEFRSNDPWWDAFFTENPPENFSDLGYGSYTRAYYDLLDMPQNVHVIAVEHQNEMRIFETTKGIVQRGAVAPPQGNNRLTGLYPFDGVVFPESAGNYPSGFFSNIFGKKSMAETLSKSYGETMDKTLVEKVINAAAKQTDLQSKKTDIYKLPIVSKP